MKTAVITGASSGLGREFVRQFYSVFPEIERVWLIARRTDRLQELAEQLEEKGISTLTLPLDLCDTMSFTAYQEHLVEEQPEMNFTFFMGKDYTGSYPVLKLYNVDTDDQGNEVLGEEITDCFRYSDFTETAGGPGGI